MIHDTTTTPAAGPSPRSRMNGGGEGGGGVGDAASFSAATPRTRVSGSLPPPATNNPRDGRDAGSPLLSFAPRR
jgi:hypothetical protein